MGPLVVSPEAAVLLAAPDGFDDPVIPAAFEAAVEEAPLSAGEGLAEAEAETVSDNADVSLLSCPYKVYESLTLATTLAPL